MAPRRGWFFVTRVAVLSLVLAGILLYAARDAWARRARNRWDRTLDVAIVLVQAPGAGAVDPEAVAGVRARAPELAARLAAEHRRHAPASALAAPFHVEVFGITGAAEPAPTIGDGGAWDALTYAWRLRRWVADVDARASVASAAFDARIYVVARKPESEVRSRVEGRSEHGGWVGLVEVELAPDMTDLALSVAAHEMLHTLGAEDHYDASGALRVPEGLAEPSRVPLYPQRFAEVMARGRAVAPGREVLLETLDELAVGPATAREIGWLPGETGDRR